MTKGCPKCGRTVDQSANVCPYCNYQFSEIEKVYKMAENENKEKVNEYAGLIQRVAAFNFDLILMLIIFIGLLIGLNTNFDAASINLVLPFILTVIIYFFYCTVLEQSPLKGTFGARILNIEVVDDGGYQIGFGMSFKRNIAKILNILTLGIGYIILIFTKNKRALNDIISDTYVKNKSLDYNSKLYYASIVSRLIAFVVDLLIIYFISFVFDFAVNYLANSNLIPSTINISLVAQAFTLTVFILYFTLMDSKDGTFGKKLFAFKVTNLEGKKTSKLKTFIRTLLLIFEIACIPVGILLCLTHPRKQTFKDLITKTVVIKTVYYK